MFYLQRIRTSTKQSGSRWKNKINHILVFVFEKQIAHILWTRNSEYKNEPCRKIQNDEIHTQFSISLANNQKNLPIPWTQKESSIRICITKKKMTSLSIKNFCKKKVNDSFFYLDVHEEVLMLLWGLDICQREWPFVSIRDKAPGSHFSKLKTFELRRNQSINLETKEMRQKNENWVVWVRKKMKRSLGSVVLKRSRICCWAIHFLNSQFPLLNL